MIYVVRVGMHIEINIRLQGFWRFLLSSVRHIASVETPRAQVARRVRLLLQRETRRRSRCYGQDRKLVASSGVSRCVVCFAAAPASCCFLGYACARTEMNLLSFPSASRHDWFPLASPGGFGAVMSCLARKLHELVGSGSACSYRCPTWSLKCGDRPLPCTTEVTIQLHS